MHRLDLAPAIREIASTLESTIDLEGNMAKNAKSTREAKPEQSVQGYFRAIFLESPKLLKDRSNDALYERWLKDHPDEKEVPNKVRQNLSNLKSILRKKLRRRGRPKLVTDDGSTPMEVQSAPRKVSGLEQLEVQIDDAIQFAKRLDTGALEDVVRLLRGARNRVIIMSET
jgi:hypothetical protein